MKKIYDFSKGRRGAVVASDRSKVRITIRLDREIIDWFRKKVEASGGGNYQTLINNSLKESISRKKEPTEMMFRRIIKEELRHHAI
ncbi:MAG TPA: CopG family transcriptional regulator [Lentisphaeria bacterium]|nr:MAG: CopG family transcriptional regulator [Lentisphaerae bacterium GWF2_50_93]HCE45583.1 CopG family transcriptional regulator [Lentisphaeria bacterium]